MATILAMCPVNVLSTDQRHCSNKQTVRRKYQLIQCLTLVPGEGFEPPTFGLQNRCTTTVLTRQDVVIH